MTDTDPAATPRRYPAPNWERWRDAPRGTAFECVALSCDIEPWGFTEAGRATLTSPRRVSDLSPPMNVNPWLLEAPHAAVNAVASMFFFRLGITVSNISAEGPLHLDAHAPTRIRIVEFVCWARSLHWWLPEGLGMAAPAENNLLAPRWVGLALTMANDIYRRDRNNSLNPTKGEIAKEIARRFERDGTQTGRGALSAANILRNSLKDWKPPK